MGKLQRWCSIFPAVASALEQGGSVKIYPQNSLKSSNGIGDGWTEGLQGPKLPAISWISDYYLNWQAVNGTNTEIQGRTLLRLILA